MGGCRGAEAGREGPECVSLCVRDGEGEVCEGVESAGVWGGEGAGGDGVSGRGEVGACLRGWGLIGEEGGREESREGGNNVMVM